MHKCDECGQVFEEPKPLKDDAGVCLVSPCCLEGYEEGYEECKICEEYFEVHDKHTICDECAEELYTHRLGLRYIEQHPQFYLDFYGVEKVLEYRKPELIEVLEEAFIETIDMENDSNNRLEIVKEYILDDMNEWIDFLEEEGEV